MTLTETARTFKIMIRITGGIFVLFLLFKISQDTIQALLSEGPPEEALPTPTVLFGILPKPKLESVTLDSSSQPTFSLDLVEAALPTEPVQAGVYPILRAPYGFLALDRVKELAKKFNFTDEPQALSSTDYAWVAPGRTLRVDVESINFTYRYNYRTDFSVFVPGAFGNQEKAEEVVVQILRDRGLLGGGSAFGGARGADLAEGRKETRLLSFRQGELKKSGSLAETVAARTNLFRGNVKDIPFVSPNFGESLVAVLISGNKDDEGVKQVLEIDYTVWVVSYDQESVYPLRSSLKAWQLLQSDLSHLVYLQKEDETEQKSSQPMRVESFIAKNTYLAYLDSREYQKFLQPVWVFTGKARTDSGSADWAAYVPAVSEEWLEE